MEFDFHCEFGKNDCSILVTILKRTDINEINLVFLTKCLNDHTCEQTTGVLLPNSRNMIFM